MVEATPTASTATHRQRPKARIVTLGCKLNFAESATIGELLKKAGFDTVAPDSAEQPDVCIVNTCSVTSLADRKCRQQIRQLIARHPDALMLVTGCYAQLKSDEVAAIPGVDIVLGSEHKLEVVRFVEAWLDNRKKAVDITPHKTMRAFGHSCSRGDRTRYFLKVQDGCDCFCTYCTIPMARGRSRSGSIESLVAQARQAAREGGKEIVITGVNIGDFGKNTGESLIDLLRELDGITEIERYRISSIEPDLLTDEIIEFCARARAFMPHFHIPLQSGSNEVLALMQRRYRRELFAEKVDRLRQLMPDCFIGVDVMAGCRGETLERFNDSLEFIRSLDVQHLHVFPYSERPGTAALRIPHIVPKKEREARVAQLLRLSDSKQREFISRYTGTTRTVLFEQPRDAATVMHGFTDNYIRVNTPRCDARVNTVGAVRLGTINDDLSVEASVV